MVLWLPSMTVSPGITGNPDSGLENVEKPSLDAANLLILVKKLEGIKDMSERCDVCQEPIEKEKIEPIRVTVHSDRIYDALYYARMPLVSPTFRTARHHRARRRRYKMRCHKICDDLQSGFCQMRN
jgi:hypothetical protein